MNRRNFFSRMTAAIAGIVCAPLAVKAIEAAPATPICGWSVWTDFSGDGIQVDDGKGCWVNVPYVKDIDFSTPCAPVTLSRPVRLKLPTSLIQSLKRGRGRQS